MTTAWTLASVCFSRAAMAHNRSPSRPELSGVAMFQPSSSAVGTPQAACVCAMGTSRRAAARARRRNGLPSSRMLPPPFWLLRRRRDRYFHRRPLQHFLMEGVEFWVGLAPAAIGKAEIGIAEHADQADLRD